MAMIGDLAGIFSPQNQPPEQAYQPTALFAAVSYIPGKAIALIQERQGCLKPAMIAKRRLFPKSGAEETIMEQRR